jgi:GT2 family glycosyltransferase
MKLAVVILAHNAVGYVFKALRSLRRQREIDYDIILVDNGSGPFSRVVLYAYGLLFGVRTFVRSGTNLFFSPGMNLGARLARREVSHVLLLNSDVAFQDPRALATICRVHVRGATGLRAIDNHPVTIADGFFFLVDRDLYDSMGGLDEQYPWTRAITKLQAELLRAGHTVQAIRDYERLLLHFGGKSGSAWKTVHKKVELNEVASWFEGVPPVTVIPELRPD